MSKLEPHLVQPSDASDVDLFLQDLEEERQTVSKTKSDIGLKGGDTGPMQDEVKQGFARLADYLAKKKVNPYFSLQAVANRAYRLQHELFALSQNESGLQSVSQSENESYKKAV